MMLTYLIYRLPALTVAISFISAHAAPVEPTPATANACVEVDVDGHRTVPVSCLGDKMAAPQQPATAKRQQATDGLDIGTIQPNRLGQFTQSGLRNRMGNTLGTSIKPQRPPRE